MQSKIKTFSVRSEDGSVTDELPIGANAEDIDLKNGENLQGVLGDISAANGSIQDRLAKLEGKDYIEFNISLGFDQDIEIQNDGLYIANINDGEKITFISAKGYSEILSKENKYIVEVFLNSNVATFRTSNVKETKIILKKLI